MKRRRFLTGSAACAGLALSGCASLPGGGGNSLPSYHDSIPAEAVGESSSIIYIDLDGLFELGVLGDESDSATETPTSTATATPGTPSSGENAATPLVSAPLLGSVIVTYFGFGLGLGAYGQLGEQFNDQIDQERSVSQEDIDIASILFTPDAVVVEGSFTTDEYVDALPSSFSETATRDGYTIYEDDDSAAIAISDEAIVFQVTGSESGPGARAAIEQILDTQAGDGSRLVDDDPEANWALRTAGSHHFVIASFGDTGVDTGGERDRTYNPVAGTPLADVPAAPLVSGASVQGEGDSVSATADTALTHTGDSVEQSAIEDAYAGSAADISVTTADGDREGSQRVHINGEFQREGFGL